MTNRQNKIRQMMDNIILQSGFRVASLYPGDLKLDSELSMPSATAQLKLVGFSAILTPILLRWEFIPS